MSSRVKYDLSSLLYFVRCLDVIRVIEQYNSIQRRIKIKRKLHVLCILFPRINFRSQVTEKSDLRIISRGPRSMSFQWSWSLRRTKGEIREVWFLLVIGLKIFVSNQNIKSFLPRFRVLRPCTTGFFCINLWSSFEFRGI